MFDYLTKKFEIRCTEGQKDAYIKDINKARIEIEDIMKQNNCKNIEVYHWNNCPYNSPDYIFNMIEQTNGYELHNVFDFENKSYDVHITIKLFAKKKDNKIYISFVIKSIILSIYPDYTETEKNDFVIYLQSINLKEVSRDNIHVIKLFYNPDCFDQSFQNNLKQTFAKKYKIDEGNINLSLHTGKFLNLICIDDLNKKFKTAHNCIVLETQIRYNQKDNCPTRTHEYIINKNNLPEIKDELDTYLNKYHLIN